MSNRPTSSMPINESELVNDCRRALVNGKLMAPMDHIRMLCLARGASGIYNLGRYFLVCQRWWLSVFIPFLFIVIRSFRRLSGHGDTLSRNGFVNALEDIKMECTQEEADEIFTAFDIDGKGHIDMKEFLFQLRLMSLVNIHCLLYLTYSLIIISLLGAGSPC